MTRRSILFVVQAYWPDTVSSAQHVTDLCEALVEDGASVTVFCSGYIYESGELINHPSSRKGVDIVRVPHFHFDRVNMAARLLNVFSFNAMLLTKLFFSNYSFTHVLSLTSPPFSGLFALLKAVLCRAKFIYWSMDLQPELSISAGLIKEKSLKASVLRLMNRRVLVVSDLVISLDRFMSEYLMKLGVRPEKVKTLPVWVATEAIYTDAREENSFRIGCGYGDKLVIMYSGNHAYVHPLTTLLEASVELRDDPDIHFAFVGGGVRTKDVTAFKQKHRLDSLSQHEFQPRETFHISIGASDLQVVVLGSGQVGYTHPNKVYGAMMAGKPVIYIGPENSHVADLMNQCPGNIMVDHGETTTLVEAIKAFRDLSDKERFSIGMRNRDYVLGHFSRQALIEAHVRLFD